MYVSGTKNASALLDIARSPVSFFPHLLAGDLQDMWDDASKVPFGLVRYSDRYRSAEPMLLANPQVTKVRGHSLGGAVTLELAKNHPERHLETRVYGAPVLTFHNDAGERYRHPGDFISMLDFGARNEPNVNWNPHSYEGFSPTTRPSAPSAPSAPAQVSSRPDAAN